MNNVKEFTFRERQELKRSNVKGPTDKDQSILDSVVKERDSFKKDLEDAKEQNSQLINEKAELENRVKQLTDENASFTDVNAQLTNTNTELSNSLQQALNELSELKQNKMEALSGIAVGSTSGEEEVPDKTSKGKKK